MLEESRASVENAIEMVTLLAYSLNCIRQDVQQYAKIELSAQDSKWIKQISLLKRTSSEGCWKNTYITYQRNVLFQRDVVEFKPNI